MVAPVLAAAVRQPLAGLAQQVVVEVVVAEQVVLVALASSS